MSESLQINAHVYENLTTCPVATVGLVCYAGLNLCDFLVKSIMRFLFMR